MQCWADSLAIYYVNITDTINVYRHYTMLAYNQLSFELHGLCHHVSNISNGHLIFFTNYMQQKQS